MAYRSHTSAKGTGTGASPTVPSGALAYDVLVADLYIESADATITFPTGWTIEEDTGTANAALRGRIVRAWKRITVNGDATDEGDGDYDITWTTSCLYVCVVTAMSGWVRFGDPFLAGAWSDTGVSGSTSGTAANNTSFTVTDYATDQIGVTSNHATNGSGFAPPANFTERYDDTTVPDHLTVYTRDAAPSGAVSTSATLTGTTGNSYPRTILSAGILDRVALRDSGSTSPASAAAFSAALPTTYAPGDRLIGVLTGKGSTTTVPTIDQGWTLLGSGTGGTGSVGADIGPQFWAIYGKDTTADSVSSPETAPTITPGGTAPNTWVWSSYSLVHAGGKVWADAIATSAGWVLAADDTDTASPLTGAQTFPNQPTTGDAFMVVGAVPSDSSTTLDAASTYTATGMADGTVSRAYVETSLNNDCAQGVAVKAGFSGPISSAVTASITMSGGANLSGPVVFIALRQSDPVVLPPTATATATALAPTVSASQFATVAAVVAAATALALAPTVSGQENATVSPPAATATAAALAPMVDATQSPTVAPPAATASAQAWAPDVSASGSATVLPPAATSTAEAWAPTVTATQAATIAPPTATATATAHAPTVAVGTNATVSPPVATATAQAWAPTVEATEPGVIHTDLTNRDDGLDLDGTAQVVWSPDVAPRPAIFGPQLPDAITVARVITTAPGWADTFSPAVASTKSIPRLRERVTIGDADMTFLRDTPLVVDNWRLIDPLLYGSGQLTLPQVNPQFEPNFEVTDDGPVGTGDLTGIRRFSPVVIEGVNAADEVEATYYKGFISKVVTEGHQLVLELGGQASGHLSAMPVPPPVYRRKQDVEHILVDLLRDAHVRAHEHDGASGIGLIRRGGANGLDIFNETLAVWAGATGDPITFTPRADGAYRKIVKDTATIHATAYIDSDLIIQSLSQDFMEQNLLVYAHGRTASGELVTNIRTPGMTQGDVPDYPMSPGPMVLGTVDADTDSGAGVTAVQEQLALHNFYDVEDGTPGVYGPEVQYAVLRFQGRSDLGTTGEVNAATWEALFNLPAAGYSLDDAREYPSAQDIRTVKWFRTANGSKIAENPEYDPHLPPVGTFIDVGGPFGRNQIDGFAESKLAPPGGVWRGTLTFKSGLIAGEHNPGDPFTTADIIDRRDVQPNWNIWLPYFMGGIVVTLSGLDNNPEETQALASSEPETTMETWDALQRAAESKSNPGRTWSGHVRSSQVRNDETKEWDTSSGWLANKVALAAGEWTEVKVPAGQAGIIQRIRMELQTPDEFAVALTQKPLALGRLNADVSAPLTDSRPSSRPWWEHEDIATWLEDRGVLDHWGTEDQPCGYDPSLKTDDRGPTAQATTGIFHDPGGFNFETGSEPVLYLYVWTWADNFLLPGRILRNQRTTDF